MSFFDYFQILNIEEQVQKSITSSHTITDTLPQKKKWLIQDFPSLISPSAQRHLGSLTQCSAQITRQRFGRIMQIYIPLYLSNVCFNRCTYCGFSLDFKYPRKTLTETEIITEFELLKSRGFHHILLLTGEAPGEVGVDYIAQAVRLASQYFSSVGIEIQPLSVNDYQRMIRSGADSLTMYQETYHSESYAHYHLSGKKKNYKNRMETPDRAGQAGFFKMSVGALLGLYDWRYEALSLVHHVHYLQKKYWRTKFSVSFPRIQGMVGNFKPKFLISDDELIQLICAFRLVFPDLGINISTRERAEFRNRLFQLGVTSISAESKTNPGGYSGSDSEEQFEIADHRSLSEISNVLHRQGFDVVMKDWMPEFLHASP